MTRTNELHSTFKEDGRKGIRLERRLSATPEEVWLLLVEPKELTIWLTTVQVEPHVGGLYTLSFNNGMPTSLGHVTAYEPPTLLEFSWYEGEPIESRVRIELHADEEATLLVLTHTLLHDTDDLRPYAEGWTHHLERLTNQIATWA